MGWPNKIMASAVLEKETELIKKISSTEFCIYVDSEISLFKLFKRNRQFLVASKNVISHVTEGVEVRLCG
jgi:hypothetical protein